MSLASFEAICPNNDKYKCCRSIHAFLSCLLFLSGKINLNRGFHVIIEITITMVWYVELVCDSLTFDLDSRLFNINITHLVSGLKQKKYQLIYQLNSRSIFHSHITTAQMTPVDKVVSLMFRNTRSNPLTLFVQRSLVQKFWRLSN